MTDIDDGTTVLCRRCSIRKLQDDIRVNYGLDFDGNLAGGLCNRCAEEIAAVTVPAAIVSSMEGKSDVPRE